MKIPQQAELVDEDAMSQIRKGHDTMCVVLTSRHKNLDTVRAVWTTGDIKASTTLPLGFGLAQEGEAVGRGGPRHHTGSLHVPFCLRHPHKLPFIKHLLVGPTVITLGAVSLTPMTEPVITHTRAGAAVPNPL